MPSFLAPARRERTGAKGVSCRHSPGLTEQTGEQRHKGDADEGNTAARHELLDALAFRAGVIIAVAFQKVDAAPDAKTSSEGDYESLQNVYCAIKEIHK